MKKKLIQRFRDTTLYHKIICFYFAFFLIPLVLISGIGFSYITDIALQNQTVSVVQTFEQTRSFLSYRLDTIKQIATTIATDPTINTILAKDSADYTIFDQVVDHELLRSKLQILQNDANIQSLVLYVNNDFIYSEDGVLIKKLSQAEDSDWYPHFDGSQTYCAPGAYLEDGTGMALLRNIVDLNNYRNRIGILRMNIDETYILSMLENASPTTSSVTFLVNGDGVLVAVSDQAILDSHGLNDSAVLSGFIQETPLGQLESRQLDGIDMYTMVQSIDQTDWYLVTVIPRMDLLKQLIYSRNMLLLLAIGLGFVFMLMGLAAISSVTRRIHRLTESMDEVRRGNYAVKLETRHGDEIGILYEHYNSMMTQTQQLLKEIMDMGNELKSAELKALQSQINPHFLYNTLEMINWLGHENRSEDISNVITALSKFYRLSLNRGEELTTLHDELKHVSYYIQIQQLRFPDRIGFTINVNSDVLNTKLPKITLQPIVENAILHGIFETEDRKGNIRIYAQIQDQKLKLIVEDDGVGMDAAVVEQLAMKTVDTSSSYGLTNIRQRIVLSFGSDYGLSFTSEKGKGSRVTITLPLQPPEEK